MDRFRQNFICNSNYTYSSYCYAQTKNESGRSMVEMLGVLAVMGVLSIAGVAGFKSAMNRHRANELMEFLARTTALTQAQALLGNLTESGIQATIDGLKGSHVATAVMCSSTSSDSGSDTRYAIHVTNIPRGVCQVLMQKMDENGHFAMKNANVYVGSEGCTHGAVSCTSDEANAISFIFEPDDYVAGLDDPFGGNTCSCDGESCSIVNGTDIISECAASESCINNGQSLYCGRAGSCSSERIEGYYFSYANNYEGNNLVSTFCEYGCLFSEGYATCDTSPQCDKAPFCTDGKAYNWDANRGFTRMNCIDPSKCHTDGVSAWCDTTPYCAGHIVTSGQTAYNWNGNGFTGVSCPSGCTSDGVSAWCAPYCVGNTTSGAYAHNWDANRNTFTIMSCPRGCSTDGVSAWCNTTPYCAGNNATYGQTAYNWNGNTYTSIFCGLGRLGCHTDGVSAWCDTTPYCAAGAAFNWDVGQSRFTSMTCGIATKCHTDGVSAWCDTTPYCVAQYANNWDVGQNRFTSMNCGTVNNCHTDGVSAYCATTPFCADYGSYRAAYNWNGNTFTSMNCGTVNNCHTDGVSAWCDTTPYCAGNDSNATYGQTAYNWNGTAYTSMFCGSWRLGACHADGVSAWCNTTPYCFNRVAYNWNGNGFTTMYCPNGCSTDGVSAWCK